MHCFMLCYPCCVHFNNQVSVDKFCDMFQQELQDGEDVARCPSCSLIIRVIYDLASQHFVVYDRLHCYLHNRHNIVI